VDSTESRYRTRSIGTDDDPTRVGGGICVFLSALLLFEVSNFKFEIALLSPRFSILSFLSSIFLPPAAVDISGLCHENVSTQFP
jgi:hypothetical protein